MMLLIGQLFWPVLPAGGALLGQVKLVVTVFSVGLRFCDLAGCNNV